jgi:hypothetical protein
LEWFWEIEMNKKRSLKSILFLDFAVFAVLSAVYYFFSKYALSCSLLLGFLSALFIFLMTLAGEKLLKNRTEE